MSSPLSIAMQRVQKMNTYQYVENGVVLHWWFAALVAVAAVVVVVEHCPVAPIYHHCFREHSARYLAPIPQKDGFPTFNQGQNINSSVNTA